MAGVSRTDRIKALEVALAVVLDELQVRAGTECEAHMIRLVQLRATRTEREFDALNVEMYDEDAEKRAEAEGEGDV